MFYSLTQLIALTSCVSDNGKLLISKYDVLFLLS